MIVRIAHVGVAVRSLENECGMLQRVGYRIDFSDRRIPNPRIKRGLMGKYTPTHDLVVLSHDRGYPVELLAYGHCVAGRSTLTAPWPGNEGCELNRICSYTCDPEGSRAFWRELGYDSSGGGESGILEFRSPLHQVPFYMKIVRRQNAGSRVKLDLLGPVCVGFISSSIEEERIRLGRAGIRTTELERTRVNGKELVVFFAVGEYGEVAEVIGYE